ncbi:hypothetical protein RDABS01_039851, partial [Bienertia sinuspersici]
MARLHFRHIANDPSCHICGVQYETIAHCLFECVYAREIWERSQFKELVEQLPLGSVWELIDVMARKLKGHDLSLFTALMMSAWMCRNKHILEQAQPKAVDVARGVALWVEDYNTHNLANSPCGISQSSVTFSELYIHRIEARWKVEVAEARAALFGLQIAQRLGYKKVVLEGDCKSVIGTIAKEAKGFSSINLFVDEFI